MQRPRWDINESCLANHEEIGTRLRIDGDAHPRLHQKKKKIPVIKVILVRLRM